MVTREKNKLGINDGGTDIGKKIIDIHQTNEYTAVNKHKEGLCWGCFKNDAVGATVVECCTKCFEKRGKETILVDLGPKIYGMCHMCSLYVSPLKRLNVRFCLSCARRYRRHIRAFNKNDGMFGSDPFWKKMRRKLGKDYQVLFSEGFKKDY